MSLHVLERIGVQLALVGVLASTALAAQATELGPEALEHLPPAAIFAGWVVAATFAAVRFAVAYGRRMKRTPNGELSRLREELARERRARGEEELARAHRARDLEVEVARLRERLARLEGALEGRR